MCACRVPHCLIRLRKAHGVASARLRANSRLIRRLIVTDGKVSTITESSLLQSTKSCHKCHSIWSSTKRTPGAPLHCDSLRLLHSHEKVQYISACTIASQAVSAASERCSYTGLPSHSPFFSTAGGNASWLVAVYVPLSSLRPKAFCNHKRKAHYSIQSCRLHCTMASFPDPEGTPLRLQNCRRVHIT